MQICLIFILDTILLLPLGAICDFAVGPYCTTNGGGDPANLSCHKLHTHQHKIYVGTSCYETRSPAPFLSDLNFDFERGHWGGEGGESGNISGTEE